MTNEWAMTSAQTGQRPHTKPIATRVSRFAILYLNIAEQMGAHSYTRIHKINIINIDAWIESHKETEEEPTFVLRT